MLKTTWQKAALFGAAFVTLAGCASSTLYRPAAQPGDYGFAEQKIEDNRYRISFHGNSLTDRETVETYLLFRAAEVTLAEGYDHFVVVEDQTERETRLVGTTLGPGAAFGPGFFPYYGFGRPFPYYGWGYPWAPGFNDIDVRERNKYTAIAYIVMGRGDKPENVLAAYEARQVIDNLGPVVERPEVE